MRNIAFVPGRLDILWLDQDMGMNHTTWKDLLNWPANPSQSGTLTDLGGIFTSPPVAVSANSDRVDVFGLGLDYALYHRAFVGGAWSSGWERG